MKEQKEQFKSEDMLNSELLDKIGFQKDRIGCGYFYWRMEIENFDISVAPWTDGGRTEIHVYEKENYLGGVLKWGIPSFRLDKSYLDKFLSKLSSLGVNFILNKEITGHQIRVLYKIIDGKIKKI